MGAADLVIHGGILVTPEGAFPASIAVRAGRIALIGAEDLMPKAAESIDAAGLHILPGLVDVHVHLREPGLTAKEDWASGTAAAAAGGVTTVLDMPNTVPPTASVAALEQKLSLAAAKAHVDFGAYALLAEDSIGVLAALKDAGAIGFKLYMGSSTGDLPIPSDGAILEGFESIARLGLRCAVHAENGGVIARREARLKAAGRADALAHLAARPEVAEEEALARALAFARVSGARLHIAHVSAERSLPLIRAAKADGVDVTAETCPQYFLLTAEAMRAADGQRLRVNPPLRAPHNQDPLRRALADGAIDLIATDHAPHLPVEKSAARVWDCACGLPGLETLLPLLLTEVAEGRLALTDLPRLLARNPARAFGLYPQKGALAIGSDADFALVDLGRAGQITAAGLKTRAGWTPFDGRAVTGAVTMTLVRGRIVMRDGEVIGPEGWGQALRPAMPNPSPRNPQLALPAILSPDNIPF